MPIGQGFCTACGARNPFDQARTDPVEQAQGYASAFPGDPDPFQNLSPYYQEEFAKMRSNPQYEGKWNWAAFLFGGLWALTKGLWGPVLLCVVALLVTTPLGGLPALLLWFYFGARGNSMYYKKLALRQPWAFW